MYSEQQRRVFRRDLQRLQPTQSEAVAIAQRLLDGEEFLGWVNKETCVVALHLSSDYRLYHQAKTIIEETRDIDDAADAVKQWVKQHHETIFTEPSIYEPTRRVPQQWSTLLGEAGSLWRVDWVEVAHYLAY